MRGDERAIYFGQRISFCPRRALMWIGLTVCLSLSKAIYIAVQNVAMVCLSTYMWISTKRVGRSICCPFVGAFHTDCEDMNLPIAEPTYCCQCTVSISRLSVIDCKVLRYSIAIFHSNAKYARGFRVEAFSCLSYSRYGCRPPNVWLAECSSCVNSSPHSSSAIRIDLINIICCYW